MIGENTNQGVLDFCRIPSQLKITNVTSGSFILWLVKTPTMACYSFQKNCYNNEPRNKILHPTTTTTPPRAGIEAVTPVKIMCVGLVPE